MTIENENERKVLEHVKRAGRVPSYREAGDALGLSLSTVQGAINRLVAKGQLVKQPGARGVGLPPKPKATITLCQPSGDCELEILGKVAAGMPIAPPEPPGIGYFDFRQEFGAEGNQMLLIRGQSMIDRGILDGDYIVVEPADCAEDGDIVVASLNGGYTLKVFRKRRGRVYLEACNDKVKDIPIQPYDDAKVVGVYAGLVRTKKKRRGR